VFRFSRGIANPDSDLGGLDDEIEGVIEQTRALEAEGLVVAEGIRCGVPREVVRVKRAVVLGRRPGVGGGTRSPRGTDAIEVILIAIRTETALGFAVFRASGAAIGGLHSANALAANSGEQRVSARDGELRFLFRTLSAWGRRGWASGRERDEVGSVEGASFGGECADNARGPEAEGLATDFTKARVMTLGIVVGPVSILDVRKGVNKVRVSRESAEGDSIGVRRREVLLVVLIALGTVER